MINIYRDISELINPNNQKDLKNSDLNKLKDVMKKYGLYIPPNYVETKKGIELLSGRNTYVAAKELGFRAFKCKIFSKSPIPKQRNELDMHLNSSSKKIKQTKITDRWRKKGKMKIVDHMEGISNMFIEADHLDDDADFRKVGSGQYLRPNETKKQKKITLGVLYTSPDVIRLVVEALVPRKEYMKSPKCGRKTSDCIVQNFITGK